MASGCRGIHEAGLESPRFSILSPLADSTVATEKLYMTSALTLGEEKTGKGRP